MLLNILDKSDTFDSDLFEYMWKRKQSIAPLDKNTTLPSDAPPPKNLVFFQHRVSESFSYGKMYSFKKRIFILHIFYFHCFYLEMGVAPDKHVNLAIFENLVEKEIVLRSH